MTKLALRSESAFIERFGRTNADAVKTISADWLAAINSAGNIGEVIGLQNNGSCQATFGPKMTYLTAAVLMAGGKLHSRLRWVCGK